MGWATNEQKNLDAAKMTPMPFRESSLGEVFNVELGYAIDTGLSTSGVGKSMMDILGSDPDYAVSDSRPDQIKNLISNGELDEGFLDKYKTKKPRRGVKIDYESAYSEARDLGFDFATSEEVIAERDRTLKQRFDYRNDVLERAPDYSGIVGLAGSIVGYSNDPIAAVSMLIPPLYGSQGLSKVAYIGARAKEGFAIGAGTVAAIEPIIYDWNQEIGEDYTVADSAINIAASGLFSGLLSGAAAALTSALIPSRLKLKGSFKEKLMESGLDEVEADTVVKFTEDAKYAPNQKITTEEHIAEIEKSRESTNQNRFTDSEPEADEVAFRMTDEEGKTGDPEFDAIPDDKMINTFDGKRIRLKSLPDEAEAAIKFDDELLGCLTGG